MSLPAARAVECTELSASPSSQESLRRLPWCTCVSASARQSRAQCRAREFCCKILLLLIVLNIQGLCFSSVFKFFFHSTSTRQFAPVSSLSAVSESSFLSILSIGVPVLVPVRASPVPSVVRGSFVVKFFLSFKRAGALELSVFFLSSEGGRTQRKRVFGRNPTTTNIRPEGERRDGNGTRNTRTRRRR